MKIFTVLLGAAVVISVFLPWATLDIGFGFSDSVNGTDDGWGILSLVAGFACAGLAFLPIQKLRGFGLIIGGVLAGVGVAGYWSALSSEMGGLFMEAVSPGFGLFTCIAGAVALAGLGILQLRMRD